MQTIRRVKWFSAERGYGFISADGQDYFVHLSAIQGEQKILFEGDEVEFTAEETSKGLSAINVTRVKN